MARWHIREATDTDLDAVKELLDRHRDELGFVLRPSIVKSIQDHELLVASIRKKIVGCVHFHHRRDPQTTLYHIVVDETYRRQGIACALVEALRSSCEMSGKSYVLLKCPAALPANAFYERIGLQLFGTEPGKHRPLNVWRLVVDRTLERPAQDE